MRKTVVFLALACLCNPVGAACAAGTLAWNIVRGRR